jgi:O-succinylbenzoic acid--CoA ligase
VTLPGRAGGERVVGGQRLLWLAFEQVAARHPGRLALLDRDRQLTYDALRRRIADAARRLEECEVTAHAAVALLPDDPVATITWTFAAMSVGAVPALVPAGTGDAAEHVRRLGARVLVACHRVGPDVVARGRGRGPALPAGLVLATSGTTGVPKLVVHSHESLGAAVLQLRALRSEVEHGHATTPQRYDDLVRMLVDCPPEPLGLCFASTMPFHAVGGVTVALQALLGGERLTFVAPTEPELLLRTLAERQATNVSLAPFTAQLLTRALRTAPRLRPASLLVAGIGGGPVPREVAAELEESLGCVVAVGYGATEAGGPLCMGRIVDPPDVRHGTVGRPLPGVEARVDARTGELSVSTAALAPAVVGTDGHLAPVGEHGWFRTGDIADVDGHGNVTVRGRIDSLIVRGGRRIDPAVIESALESHPGVARAGVCAVPGRVPGEQDIYAFVVPGPVGEPPAPDVLRRHVRDRLDTTHTPRRVVLVDELPTTADGAVRRHSLAARVAQAVR